MSPRVATLQVPSDGVRVRLAIVSLIVAGNPHYSPRRRRTRPSQTKRGGANARWVDRAGKVQANLNQLYMAGLMKASMVVLELALMSAMYDNTRMNSGIIGTSVVALIAFWLFTRVRRRFRTSGFCGR